MAQDQKGTMFGMTQEELKKLVEKTNKAKQKEKRYWTEQKLFIRKAKAAGLTVTDAEIDAELALTAKK